ncbi:DNA-directed RNA polymerase I subunit RPA43 isoform X1 [Colius striatus]|uniref:DNA-directed RNA polymerase I subunit RPA43 isoform X1 n=1 Tax=Colius striatus TaxID=57412 RepID=UPI002B1E46D8|nr:DNA-directed RNA polymerase I subunit RPA43 isoform X1 [Colius striatus]
MAVAGEPPPPSPALPAAAIPSFAVARGLVGRRYSCLVVAPHRRHVALPPRYLGHKRTGIRAQLDAELLRYSESLQGVPVAYDNIKVVGELGDIYDDQGFIHLNIEADFVIFSPKKGKKLVDRWTPHRSSLHLRVVPHTHGSPAQAAPTCVHLKGCSSSLPLVWVCSAARRLSSTACTTARSSHSLLPIQVCSPGAAGGSQSCHCPPWVAEGTINKVAPSHIGCLIHGCFNASIPKPEQMSIVQWQKLGLKIGDELKFQVLHLDSDAAGVFFIRGGLTKSSMQPKQSETVTDGTNGDEIQKLDQQENGLNDSEGDTVTEEPVAQTDSNEREDTEEQNTDTVNGLCDGKNKKKKKKKHKQEQQEHVLPTSDSSGYQSDHKKSKKKKRKHCNEAEENELSQLSEEPKTKKKKGLKSEVPFLN